MSPELEALRSNRAVAAAVVTAAVAVTLLCLVGIAVMLGWAGRQGATTPVGIASPAQQVAGTATDIDLVPGETLVEPATPPRAAPATAPSRPEPMMPSYGKPAAPRAAPRAPTPAPPARAAATAIPAPEREPAQPPIRALAAPAPPQYARPVPHHPTDPDDDWPQGAPCRACGTVTAIATFPDLWEVRVRFDAGGSRIVRFPTAPPYRIGDRVRLANGRLERE
jgi:hypothetical protein